MIIELSGKLKSIGKVRKVQMNEFWQTFLIAIIPSTITALLSFFASWKTSNTQIKTIKEQNKADIEKLIQQNKVDIESLKEKHVLEMELKDKEHDHQIELIKLQHENEIKKDEENVKNQFAANAFGSLMGTIFSQESPVSGTINEAIKKGIEDSMNKKQDE